MLRHEVLSAERLREILAMIPGVEDVAVDEDEGRLVARVIAARWDGIEDHERQAEIYGVLLEKLHLDDLWRVEFVFTDTPSEYAELAAARA